MTKAKKNKTTDDFYTKLAASTGGELLADVGKTAYFVDTGNLAFNFINSGKFITGGIPGGKITEIYGPPGGGKSLLGNCILAGCQKIGGIAVFLDCERAQNAEFAQKAAHVNVEQLVIYDPITIEQVEGKIFAVTKAIRKVKGNDVPIVFVWDGDAMVPMKRFAKTCDQVFVVHEYYRMDVIKERSRKSHNHYFACIHSAWLNLPEKYAMEPWAQTEDHLRYYALIKTGWFDSLTHACGTQAEAQRWAARLRPLHEYSIVVARGSIVVVYTAKSQSKPAMGARDFQKSKVDVLDFVEDLICVDRGALEGSAA